MIPGTWLEKIANGQLKVDLSLTLTNGRGQNFTGHGFLNWTKNDGVRIEAITDGAEQLFGSGQIAQQPGTLFSEERYLTLAGKTGSGESLTIERMLSDDIYLNAGHPSVVWRFDQSSVLSSIELKRPESSLDANCYTEILFFPSLSRFPRVTETSNDNPHFPRSSSRYDWCEFHCSLGVVVAQRCPDELMRVRVTYTAGINMEAVDAIGLAFSFVEGQPVYPLAYETFDGTQRRRVIPLRPQKDQLRRFQSPLGTDPRLDQFREPLLAQATDFFLTPTGREAGDLLFTCLDSTNATFTSHALVVCVALESLVKLLVTSKPGLPPINEKQVEELKKYLTEQQWNEKVVLRISGFLGKLDEVSPKNILRKWAESKVLGITSEDVKAWDNLRNSAAHGKLLWRGDHKSKQRELSHLDAVRTVVIKILLNAMGYRGHFMSPRSWLSQPFQPIDDVSPVVEPVATQRTDECFSGETQDSQADMARLDSSTSGDSGRDANEQTRPGDAESDAKVLEDILKPKPDNQSDAKTSDGDGLPQ